MLVLPGKCPECVPVNSLRASARAEPNYQVAVTHKPIRTHFPFQEIITNNAKMFAVFDLIQRLADRTSTVLIEGETGTGKEQVARAIHEMSWSRSGPLVAVNCAALPENLLESELFGHEKGAFTSAVGTRHGRFELANGGTLFLDEVGDIPAPMQAKLLRVLQERRFERVGGAESINVDVRVIGASNRSLARLVKEGKLREDLFYRLNVIKIDLPPLRERTEDIPLLAAHFAAKYAMPGQPAKQIDAEAMQVLLSYDWPGNIRELENAIERACVTSGDGGIHMANLPVELSNRPAPAGAPRRYEPPLERSLARPRRPGGKAIPRRGDAKNQRAHWALCRHLRAIEAKYFRKARGIQSR